MSKLSSNAYRSGPPTSAGVNMPAANPIDSLLDALEAPLAALGSALRQRDAQALERQVVAVQAALAAAMPRLRQPLRTDELHSARPRVAAAHAQLGAQRACLARESAMIERGLALLMPAPEPTAVYGTQGQAERPASRGLYV